MISLHMPIRKYPILSALVLALLICYMGFKSSLSPIQGAGNESVEIVLASLTHSDTVFFKSLSFAIQDDDTLTPYTASSIPFLVPINKGNEAIVYLTHLITHYDKLAPITLFLHHHASAWHNPILLNGSAVAVISRLNRGYVVEHGFTYVGCDWHHGCDSVKDDGLTAIDLTREDFTIGLKAPHDEDEIENEKLRFRRIWTEVLPNRTYPSRFGGPRGGQFAVSRRRARSVPRKEYERLRQWIIETELDDKAAGAVFEQIWHLVVGGDNDEDPCIEGTKCYCDLYNVCLSGSHDAHAHQWLERLIMLHDKAGALEAKIARLRTLNDSKQGSNHDKEMISIMQSVEKDADRVDYFNAVLDKIILLRDNLLEEYSKILAMDSG